MFGWESLMQILLSPGNLVLLSQEVTPTHIILNDIKYIAQEAVQANKSPLDRGPVKTPLR